MSVDVMTAGTDRTLNFTLEDEENGSIAGASIEFWIGLNRLSTGADRLVAKSTAGGTDEIEILNAATRLFAVKLLPADTEDLNEGQYYMEAKLTIDGYTYKPVTGSLFIETAAP